MPGRAQRRHSRAAAVLSRLPAWTNPARRCRTAGSTRAGLLAEREHEAAGRTPSDPDERLAHRRRDDARTVGAECHAMPNLHGSAGQSGTTARRRCPSRPGPAPLRPAPRQPGQRCGRAAKNREMLVASRSVRVSKTGRAGSSCLRAPRTLDTSASGSPSVRTIRAASALYSCASGRYMEAPRLLADAHVLGVTHHAHHFDQRRVRLRVVVQAERLPIGDCPGQNVRANVSLTTATAGAVLASAAEKSRPITKGIRSVEN